MSTRSSASRSPGPHSPIAGVMEEHIVGFAELAAAPQGPRRRRAEDAEHALPRPASVSRSRAPRCWTADLSHPPQGQVPAVPLLAGDALLRPDALGGGAPSTQQPGMSERNLTPGLVPGRYRALLAGGEQSEPAHGAGAQPQLPRRDLPDRGHARRRGGRVCWRTRASPCPSSTRPSTAWRRRASPIGTSSCRAITTPPGSRPTASTRRCSSTPRARPASPTDMAAKGIRLLTAVHGLRLLHGLQHAGPGGGRRAASVPACCAGPSSIAVDFEEFISIFANGRGVVGPVAPAAGNLRRPGGGGRYQSLCLRVGGRQAGAQIHGTGQGLAGRGRLSGRVGCRRPVRP